MNLEALERRVRTINRKVLWVTILNVLTWAAVAAIAWAYTK